MPVPFEQIDARPPASQVPAAPLPHGLITRLARVRSGIRAWLWVDGSMRLLWLVLTLAAIDLVLDYVFRMDHAQRTVMLLLNLGIISWSIFRWLIRPLTTTATDDALALQLEAANPRLGQALITSLQLARLNERQRGGLSTTLVNHAITAGVKMADEVSFGGILDSRRLARNTFLLLLAVFCIVTAALALPWVPALRTWISRNVFLSSATWPQQTYLVIERLGKDGSVAFPRGGNWTQIITVRPDSAQLPPAVVFESRGSAFGPNRRSLAMQRTSDRQFETSFTGIVEPFEFRVRGGDALTEWTRAIPVEPPALTDLTITAVPPRYTGLPTENLQSATSPYQILHGSRLHISATTNKPLAAATLLRDEARWQLLPDTEHPSHLIGDIPAAELAAGSYSFQLADTLGLTNEPLQFGLQWRADLPPKVAARLPGIGNMILPQVLLPFTCQATDDYGLTSLAIVTRITTEGQIPPSAEQRSPLANLPTLSSPGEPSTHRELNTTDQRDLAPWMLTPGSVLTIHFEAADNDNVSGPHIGRSSDFTLRVVTEAEFRTDLLRREKLERQELEALTKNQDDLLTDCRALLAAWSTRPPTQPDPEDSLPKLHRGQKIIGEKLAAIASRLNNLADEARHNRLPDPDNRLHARLTQEIAAPLATIATQTNPPLIQTLDRARLVTTTDRPDLLTKVAAEQAAISARLKQTLEQMTSSEGFQEALDLLYEIQKAQGDVYEQTNKAREQRVRQILEGRP